MNQSQTKKIRCFFVLVLLISMVFLMVADRKQVSAGEVLSRVSYQITTFKENKENQREILSQATIDGLPGTDFKIILNTHKFKMETHFVNDLTSENHLQIRAHLSTRRFYGYSPNNLPLYEEDNQTKKFDTSFGETIVLIPFGNNDQTNIKNYSETKETLKIEIVPTLIKVSENERATDLTINFDKQIPSGEISITAEKIPHKFNVEAWVELNGQVVARGSNFFSLEEENEIRLLPTSRRNTQTIPPDLKVKLTVDRIIRNYSQDLAGLKFDFYSETENDSKSSPKEITQGTGICPLASTISYSLEKLTSGQTGDYQLRFKIVPANEEK